MDAKTLQGFGSDHTTRARKGTDRTRETVRPTGGSAHHSRGQAHILQAGKLAGTDEAQR